ASGLFCHPEGSEASRTAVPCRAIFSVTSINVLAVAATGGETLARGSGERRKKGRTHSPRANLATRAMGGLSKKRTFAARVRLVRARRSRPAAGAGSASKTSKRKVPDDGL